LSANKICEHLVHVADDALQKLALRFGVNKRKSQLAENLRIL
jgi:hypothetical protein